jgi:hypothetical protein
MSQPLFVALVVFAAVMAFTPGPNNVMVLSSGLTYGFRRTLPHIAGIAIGVSFMVAAMGLGLGTIFIAYPVLQTILKYAGIAYLIYLAFGIAMSASVASGQDNRRGPMTFCGAVPMGQRQGLGDGDWHHYRLFRDCQLSLEHRHAGRPDVRYGRVVLAGLGSFRQFAAADPDLSQGRQGLQYPDGPAAAGLALSRLDGRMMPRIA